MKVIQERKREVWFLCSSHVRSWFNVFGALKLKSQQDFDKIEVINLRELGSLYLPSL